MGYERHYQFNHEENNGYISEPCDILVQHYKSDNFRTISIRKEEWNAWKICEALNHAYKVGREDAMSDLRRMIGADK